MLCFLAHLKALALFSIFPPSSLNGLSLCLLACFKLSLFPGSPLSPELGVL